MTKETKISGVNYKPISCVAKQEQLTLDMQNDKQTKQQEKQF